MIDRPIYLSPNSHQSALSLLMCLLVAAIVNCILFLQEEAKETSFFMVKQARENLTTIHLHNGAALVLNTNTGMEPANWPLRVEVNEVLRHAGETAQAQGIALRTISISDQGASIQAWGRINLAVSASGRYAALKAWQSAFQNHSASLSLQFLRMQGNPSSGSGDLDVQAIWVLHVRD